MIDNIHKPIKGFTEQQKMRQHGQIDIAQFMSSQARESAINKMIALLIIFFLFITVFIIQFIYIMLIDYFFDNVVNYTE